MNVNPIISYDYIHILTNLFTQNSNSKNNFNYDIIKIFEQILKKDKYQNIYQYIQNDIKNYFYNISSEELIYTSNIIYSYSILHFNNINDDEILMYTNYIVKNYNKKITLTLTHIHLKYYNFILNKYINMMNTW